MTCDLGKRYEIPQTIALSNLSVKTAQIYVYFSKSLILGTNLRNYLLFCDLGNTYTPVAQAANQSKSTAL